MRRAGDETREHAQHYCDAAIQIQMSKNQCSLTAKSCKIPRIQALSARAGGFWNLPEDSRVKIPEDSSFVPGFWNLPEDSGVKIPEVSSFVTGFRNLPEDSS